ncbi:hypothetical protein KR054_006217 [Drosophila jambulina]|nr:hypothetical protein KR054_006217 [Drosophila jambulina]
MIEQLKETIKRNRDEISDLEGRLNLTEIHLAYHKDKVNLYEVIVKDKDGLIKVLQDSIELIKTTTNDKTIKEMQRSEAEIVNFNNDNNLQKQNDSLETIALIDEKESRNQENDANYYVAQLQELERRGKNDSAESHGKEDLLGKLQEQLEKGKRQNESLELINSELMVELDELKSKIIESQKTEDSLRKQVSELENNFLSVSAKLKESCEKLSEYSLNIESYTDKEDIVPLNYTKNPNIKIIKRDGMQPFMAMFEDIPSAGSGWMVIQRRCSDKFSTFCENAFSDGFGDMNADFWMGPSIIHQLTTSQRHELIIQVVDFDDVPAYARYDHFEIGSRHESFKIKSLGSYSGNAGDALQSFQNAPLEKWLHGDKSFNYWWTAAQVDCNLNGIYKSATICGFFWGRWSIGKTGCLLKSCKMLIRPRNPNI